MCILYHEPFHMNPNIIRIHHPETTTLWEFQHIAMENHHSSGNTQYFLAFFNRYITLPEVNSWDFLENCPETIVKKHFIP